MGEALGAHRPLRFNAQLFELRADGRKADKEELLARVDFVDLLSKEVTMELLLQTRGVIAKDHSVDVELKRHACITQLTPPIQRFALDGSRDSNRDYF
jgi:hypothetical protein